MKKYIFLGRLLFLSVFVVSLCSSCGETNKEEGYDYYDFDPYSSTRNPYESSIGFYIDNHRFINSSSKNMYGWETRVGWGEVTLQERSRILLVAEMIADELWDPFCIEEIWLCMPYDDIIPGRWYSVSDTDNAMEIYTQDNTYQGVPFVEDDLKSCYGDGTVCKHSQYVQFSSLNVRYDSIIEDIENHTKHYRIIEGCFNAEAVLNLDSGAKKITIENGIFHLAEVKTTKVRLSYETWLKQGREYLYIIQ